MTITRIVVICLSLIVFCHLIVLGQDESRKTPDQSATKSSTSQTRRQVWVKLKTGEIITGNLLKVDTDTVEFKVRDILQTISLDQVSNISFVAPSNSPRKSNSEAAPDNEKSFDTIGPMSINLKPTIIYKEKPKYTKEAIDNHVEGLVVLNVVFTADGRITSIVVIKGLPYGLTEKAIEAAKKIRFQPATKDDQPVSVRGNLEF